MREQFLRERLLEKVLPEFARPLESERKALAESLEPELRPELEPESEDCEVEASLDELRPLEQSSEEELPSHLQ